MRFLIPMQDLSMGLANDPLPLSGRPWGAVPHQRFKMNRRLGKRLSCLSSDVFVPMSRRRGEDLYGSGIIYLSEGTCGASPHERVVVLQAGANGVYG